jgi:Uma2 family endonuclease
MTTSPEHEEFKELLGKFVSLVAEELGIPHKSMGETTWKRMEVSRGIEADQCFYFRPAKLAAAANAKARGSRDVAHYPNPDLAIEVDLSPSELDRPGIYAALKVAEVWRFNGKELRIDRLSTRGRYIATVGSKLLPVRAEQVRRWILEEDTSDHTAWLRRARKWVKAEISKTD